MKANIIIISRWIGELGNNLEQIAASILWAKCVNGKSILNFPNFNNYEDFLNIENELFFNKEYDYEVKEFDLIDWVSNCYYTPILNYINKNYENLIIDNIANIFRENIKSMLKFNNLNNKFNIDKNVLTIHLRGGDILNGTHSLYQQANVSWQFYKNILETRQYKKIIICKEDKLNIFYEKILSFCLEENIQVDDEQRTICEDYCILMNSSNILVSGFSTFSLTASYMNEKLNNFYYPAIAPRDQSYKEKIRLKILDKTQCKLNIYDEKNSLVII
jgi:hypothetical protein